MPELSTRDRITIYPELEKLIRAGFGLDRAAGLLLERTRTPGASAIATALREGIDRGQSLSQSLTDCRYRITGPDLTIIRAAEEAGVLEEAFAWLRDYYDTRLRVRNQLRARLIYPFVLLHLASILPALPGLVSGQVSDGEGILGIVLTLAVIYFICFGVWVIGNWLWAGARKSTGMDSLLGSLPMVGGLHRNLAMERFCKVLAIHIRSGRRFSHAMLDAGEASASARIQEAAQEISEVAHSGNLIGPAMSQNSAFPTEFAVGYESAEQAGTLEEELKRWGTWHEQGAQRALEAIGFWVPKLIFAIAAGYVIWMIIALYKDYLQSIMDILPA